MSTTFAIHKHGKIIYIVDDCAIIPECEDENMVEVAFRGNGTGIWFTNDVAPSLPPDTNVYAVDNSQQGIFTIGDILNEVKNNQPK